MSTNGLRRLAGRLPALCLLTFVFLPVAGFGASSLRFRGNRSGDFDRVKILIDDSAASGTGARADVGASDFTIEFWMKASAADNTAGPVACGASAAWVNGNVVVDRGRSGPGRGFGVSIAGGRIVFGVSGEETGDLTICGSRDVIDAAWHHVAVTRESATGRMEIFVDGLADAQGDGPSGDVSYPDDAAAGEPDDPYLVFGAGKHEVAGSPSYSGFLDEIRVSSLRRYSGPFARPRSPFTPDAGTVALYHLDEGVGDFLADSSGADGGAAHGQRLFGGSPAGPDWDLSEVAPLGGAPSLTLTPLTTVSKPVQVTHAGDGSDRLFIVEQTGQIRIYDDGQLLPTAFLDVTALISTASEQGLLSVAFHPSYSSNGSFYIYYTDNIATPGDITVARYQVSANPDIADPESGQILLVIPHPVNDNHNGGQLFFGPNDGYLYMGTGDGGGGGDGPNNAQTLGVLLGKILRLDVDGTGAVPCGQTAPAPYAIPASNPFVGEAGCDEIWAYGMRNPWRFAFDRSNGDLFIGDVGQESWEEIDYQPASSAGGENYGWRRMEGAHCYNPPANCNDGSLTLPIFEYDHSASCSVTGGYRYRGAGVPLLSGVYLFADFCGGQIYEGVQAGDGTWSSSLLLDTSHNISGFGEDEAGEMYLCALGGGVFGIGQTPGPAPSTTSLSPGSAIAGDPGFILTVDGAGFLYGSVVRWNGADRPTTWISPTRLEAAISASDVASAGQSVVTVFTPPPGGGESEPRPFHVNETFLDVPTSHFAAVYIQAVFDAGVSAGCGPRLYCPEMATTRAQMAVFLLKASQTPGYLPPPCTGAVFGDVPCQGGAFDPWIEDLALRGVTGGCGGGDYCPGAAVTRGQMATFLLKMSQGEAYTPPPCTGSVFDDVPCQGGAFDPWIEDLFARGITSGCGAGNYCPTNSVTRAQMAVFLTRTFKLPVP